ncbi:MAG TPA: 30S ribosomal protein S9 [Acidimicrobiia bacterium]|uniref:Small ribosomal subunit protein uS9 n=1 Tax=uncultured actinobacterium Rifle_16ft_4_minimus_2010 TaxID=1665146 RepID=A0A0H4T587_9ACTN|nr:30S ribosomal protein S9 [uncultured actinobacterium Rifle_16ft_4_minimus_2010]HLE38200.1 30S ribosomal protein S9 [Acidimicrobiia bacterium]
MTKPLAMTVGRRKTSVVRIRLRDGSGKVTLNGKSIEAYFPTMANQIRVLEPMRVAGLEGRYDVEAILEGGGVTGQVDGLRLAIARALIEIDLSLRPALKKAGLLTRDPRAVERKKYGLRKARRAPQYTKR